MAVSDFFVWGQGGTKKTPDEIAREREMADAILMRAGNTDPVGHWTQGAARVVDALGGVLKERRAAAGEQEIAGVNKNLIASLLSGGSSAPATSSAIPMTSAAGEVSGTAPASPSRSSGVLPSSFLGAVDTTEGGGGYDTLYGHAQRGKFAGTDVSAMPIRDVIAFTDPNGPYAQSVKSQIGRVATPVGRHQIVGTTLRNAVAELGLDPNVTFDQTVQDQIALHLAKKRVASADTLPGKISALRSEWHGFKGVPDEQMAQIVADIEGAPVEVAAVAPQTATDAIEAVAPSGYVDPMASAPNYDPVAASQPVVPAGGEASSIPVAEAITAPAQAPVQVAQASGINPAIIEALTNPQATPQTQRIAAMLLQQEQEKQQMAEEQRLQAADPLRQLQIRKAQQELERGQPLVNAGDGAVYNPNTGEWLQAPNATRKPPQVVELFDEATGQPYKATWNAEKGEYERVGGVKARSGMQLTTNPDGTVTLTEGAIGGLPKLTEAEGRNSGFYGRGVESHKILNDLEGEGTSLMNKVAGSIPIAGNYLRSEDAQKYDQAKRDYINAVLRRESGAVISPEEFKNAEQQYFPQPGDGPEVIEQKRRNRETTIQGLKISAGQGAAFAVPSEAPPEKKRLRFNPATGELE